MVRRCGALRVRALAGDLLCRVDAVAATGAAAEAKQRAVLAAFVRSLVWRP